MVGRLSIALASLAVAVSAAQSPPASLTSRPDSDKPVTETKHLKLRLSANPQPSAAGGRVSLFVDVEPKPKMHVYSPDQKDYIPIALALIPDSTFSAQAVKFPPAETYFFAPLKETQRVYSKPFRIEQPVTLTARNAAKEVTIKGTVRYQACDDAICYVPQNVPVAWSLTVK